MGGDMFSVHHDLVNLFLIVLIYAEVLVIGNLVIGTLMKKLNYENPFSKRGDKKEIDFAIKQSSILGFIERFLFLSSFLIQKPEFLIAWFTFKTVIHWKRWKEDNGRVFFNNFLIGNALNIMYSFLGYAFVKWGGKEHWFPNDFCNSILLGALLLIICLLPLFFLIGLQKRGTSKNAVSIDEVEVVSESTYVEVNSESSKISINKEKRNKKSG
jgi:hypothetical protein